MLTASHMPYNSNGLKFFTAAGGLEKGDIAELLQLAIKVHTHCCWGADCATNSDPNGEGLDFLKRGAELVGAPS